MSYQHLRSRRYFAAKPHRCIWCGESIKVNELYALAVGTFEGRIQHDRFHLECERDKDDFFDSNPHQDSFHPFWAPRPSVEPEHEILPTGSFWGYELGGEA